MPQSDPTARMEKVGTPLSEWGDDDPAVIMAGCVLCHTCAKSQFYHTTNVWACLLSDHQVFRFTTTAHCMACGNPVKARKVEENDGYY